jgi:hypothetical protein
MESLAERSSWIGAPVEVGAEGGSGVAQVVKGDAALEIIYRKQASSGVVMHRKRLLGCVGTGVSAWLEWVGQEPRDLPQTF